MFNKSFFPTPADVAHEMLSHIPAKVFAGKKILEPSAGKGDLLDAACEYLASHYYQCRPGIFRNNDKFLCIEIEPELQSILRDKGYRLVAHDFLSWQPDEYFDCIIMNPPFENAEEHLLKAWEILPQGDILCLIGSHSLANQYSTKRKEVSALIEEHGTVYELGACFTQAERKTSVNVSLIHLTKEQMQNAFSFEGLASDRQQDFFDASTLESQVATRNVVGNMVLEYGKCLEIFKEIAKLAGELSYYSRHLVAANDYENAPKKVLAATLEPLFGGTPTTEQLHYVCSAFTQHLKRAAWHKVFDMSKFSTLVSSKVRRDFQGFCNENNTVSFSEENIFRIFESLLMSRGEIQRQCVLEVFDELTEYYNENRMHPANGWKTNDSWRVNRRVILPYCVESCYRKPYISSSKTEKLNDIDRAMGMFTGLKLEEINSIVNSFKAHADKLGNDLYGSLLDSEYFQYRAYRKGTLHLFFKDKDLWERFNVEAARGKNWLPDDYKAREKAQKKNDKDKTQASKSSAGETPSSQLQLPLAI